MTKISTCFHKKRWIKFFNIVVCVDGLDLVGIPEEAQKAFEYLKKEFAIKDFEKTRFFLGLKIEHLKNRIFFHQTVYSPMVLKQFYIDKVHSFNIPMVIRSLYPAIDSFKLREEDEEILTPEVLFVNIIDALMYLANRTKPDIYYFLWIYKQDLVPLLQDYIGMTAYFSLYPRNNLS